MTETKATAGVGTELILERVFDAPRERVFAAWTDAKQVRQWWGPHGFDNPRCEWDARPGGKIYVDMRGFGTTHPMPGRFEEVVPPERLVFITEAFVDEAGKPQLQNRNTVTFTEQGGKTHVKLHVRVLVATPQVAQALAGMEQGWSESLEKLGALLGKG